MNSQLLIDLAVLRIPLVFSNHSLINYRFLTFQSAFPLLIPLPKPSRFLLLYFYYWYYISIIITMFILLATTILLFLYYYYYHLDRQHTLGWVPSRFLPLSHRIVPHGFLLTHQLIQIIKVRIDIYIEIYIYIYNVYMMYMLYPNTITNPQEF
jgi:hypothetical protein